MQAVEVTKDRSPAKKAGLLLLFAAVLIFFAVRSSSKPHAAGNQAFFTTDDGATLFADSADKLPPFDHNGKPACRAVVYSGDNGKTKSVAYLERFTDEGKTRTQQRIADFRSGKPGPPPVPMLGDTEVKLPGAANPWVNTADVVQATKIRSANISNESSTVVQILPQ